MTRTITVNQKEADKELVDGTYWGEASDYNIQSRAESVEFTVSDYTCCQKGDQDSKDDHNTCMIQDLFFHK